MFGIGTEELAFIFFIAFIVFGPKRLPEISRYLARLARQYKQTVSAAGLSGEDENVSGNGYSEAKLP
ncbi:MAG: twin-arginine translocase TatA/TatE family subunit [Candidatus Omnitrophota bacterium]|nr:twin-arginine translocase TatA/TatE family subunit [Candidatus Omnitrophota bacterium]